MNLDFVKYAFNEAVGKLDQHEDYSKALAKRIEPTIGELPAVLESSLSDLHRPIRKEHEITLSRQLPRPRYIYFLLLQLVKWKDGIVQSKTEINEFFD